MSGRTGVSTRQGSALHGVLIVDCSLGNEDSIDRVSLLICRLLGGAGAHVVRVSQTMDHVESDEACRARHGGHGPWELVGAEERARALADADVVLVRSETPLPWCSGDADRQLSSEIPDSAVVVVLDEGEFVDRRLPVRSHELVAQAVAGVVFEHVAGRPAYNGIQLGTYGAAMNAATAIVAALIERMETGAGQQLRVARWAGAVSFMGMVWSDDSDNKSSAHGSIPVGADVPLFECADGEYVCLSSSPRCPNPLEVLTDLLELDVDPEALRGTRRYDDLTNYFYNYEVLAPGFRQLSSVVIVDRLRAADFAVEIVRPPGAAWYIPDVIQSGLLSCCPGCGTEYVGVPVEGF